MEVSGGRGGRAARAGFPYQTETSCSCAPRRAICTAFCLQHEPEPPLTFTAAPSLSLQVGHPVLPPTGLHPRVHHGAGPGSKAGTRVQQAQRENDCSLHRQRPGSPVLVQGTGSGELQGARAHGRNPHRLGAMHVMSQSVGVLKFGAGTGRSSPSSVQGALCSLIQEENKITAVPPRAERVTTHGGDARTSEEGSSSTDPQEVL